jgi:chemotaxis protein CheX
MPENMDRENLIQTARDTTKDVFATMLGMEAVPLATRTEEGGPGPSDGVVGIIGIAGTWVGTGIVICQAGLACKAASAMMMTEYTSVNEEVLDAMGEITNMIIGNIKTNLEDRYGTMGISVPTVVFGRNFATRTVSRGEWVIVSFVVADEDFQVHVNLALNPNQPQTVVPGFVRTEPVLA